MQRYFVNPLQIEGSRITIVGDDVKHITKVLRYTAGDRVVCCDGIGGAYLVKLEQFYPDAVSGVILKPLAEQPEPLVRITLAQALPKGDKMDMIIQKGTELGVYRFVPLISERTIVQYDERKEAKRLERWRRIAKEAAEQSRRLVIPEILPAKTFREFVPECGHFDLLIIPYEAEHVQGIRRCLEDAAAVGEPGTQQKGDVCVIIGPEGGFSETEIVEATAAGAKAVTLGPRVLRTETAGLVAGAVILYHYGELGG